MNSRARRGLELCSANSALQPLAGTDCCIVAARLRPRELLASTALVSANVLGRKVVDFFFMLVIPTEVQMSLMVGHEHYDTGRMTHWPESDWN